MARNPIFPKTPGENVVDRFLNQTLPRVISQREDAKYRSERDQVADKKWKAQYQVTLASIDKSDAQELEKKRNQSITQMDSYNNSIDKARHNNTPAGMAEAESRFGSIENNTGYSYYYNNLSLEDKSRYMTPDDKFAQINNSQTIMTKSSSNYIDFIDPNGTQETRMAAYNKQTELYRDEKIPYTELVKMQSFAQGKGFKLDFGVKTTTTNGMTPSRYEGQFKELSGSIAALKKDIGYVKYSKSDDHSREYVKAWVANSGLKDNFGQPYIGNISTGMDRSFVIGTKENEAWRDHVVTRTRETLENIKVTSGLPELFSVSSDSNKKLLWQRHAGLLMALDPDLQGLNMEDAYTLIMKDSDKNKSFVRSIKNFLGESGLDYYQKLGASPAGLLSVPIKMLHNR